MKYELKRSLVFILILGIIFGVVKFGFGPSLGQNINSVSVIDNDNSQLSREFIDYLQTEQNFRITEDAINKIIIPAGFEEEFYLANATLDTGISITGIKDKEIYEFQLFKLNDENRITAKAGEVGGSFILVLLLVTVFVNIFAETLYINRRLGTIQFISNHINYWIYFVIAYLITLIIIVLMALISEAPIKILTLILILFLSNVVLIFKLRKNPKILENITYINYGIVILLILAKVMGMQYLPLVDLLFNEYTFIYLIDALILIILIAIVSRIKLTE